MALEGGIRDFGITEILQLIGMQNKTGILTLNSPDDTVTVTFDNGAVVAAESYRKGTEEILGQLLVAAEVLSREDLERALQIQKETGQKLGHILVQEGMAEPKVVTSMIQLQVRETVYRIFEWEEGTYRFDQVPVFYDRANMMPLQCEQILMDAMRILDEWPMVRKVISTFDLVFRKVDEKRRISVSGEDLDRAVDRMFEEGREESSLVATDQALQKDFPLSLLEERIYRLVDGERDVRKLIHMGRVGRFETCKALYSLVSAGLILPVEGEENYAADAEVSSGGWRSMKILKKLVAYSVMFLLMFVLLFSLHRSKGGVFGVLTGWSGRLKPIKTLHAVQGLHHLQFACRVYFLETESPPAGVQPLLHRGILDPLDALDPWGHPFGLALGKRDIRIFSAGADGRVDTPDDLVEYLSLRGEKIK